MTDCKLVDESKKEGCIARVVYGLGISAQRQNPLPGRLESITDSKMRKPVEARILAKKSIVNMQRLRYWAQTASDLGAE